MTSLLDPNPPGEDMKIVKSDGNSVKKMYKKFNTYFDVGMVHMPTSK